MFGRGVGPTPPAAPAPATGVATASVGLGCGRLLRCRVCWFRFLLWSDGYLKVP